MNVDELTVYYTAGRRLQHITANTSTLVLDLPSSAYPETAVAVAPQTNSVISYKRSGDAGKQISISLPQAMARVRVQGYEPIDGLLQELSPETAVLQTKDGLRTIGNYNAVEIVQRFAQQPLEVSYLLNDLSWVCEYTMLLDMANDMIKTLNAKADITNDTGYNFDVSNLRVVTGYVRT